MPTDAFPADAITIPWGRIALVLVLTLLATLGAVAAARGAGRGAGRGKQRLLGLVDTLPLGPNRAIYVVEAAGHQLLLAVTNDQVTSLGELQAAPAPAAPPVLAAVAAPSALAAGAAPVEAPPPREPEPLRLLPPAAGALGPSPFDRVLEGIRSFDARAGRRERTV